MDNVLSLSKTSMNTVFAHLFASPVAAGFSKKHLRSTVGKGWRDGLRKHGAGHMPVILTLVYRLYPSAGN